jgi:hypothetical protein
MGKGSKPRNNHSTQFRDNYDDIQWSKPSNNTRMHVSSDCVLISSSSADREWIDRREETVGYSTIEGMIRQSTDNPVDSDNTE